MSEEQQNFSAEENLAFIRTVMDDAKRKTANYGPWILLWGSLSSLATFGQYLGVRGVIDIRITPLFWLAMLVCGLLGTRYLAKKCAPVPVQNSELINVNIKIWQGAGLAIFMYFVGKLGGLFLGTAEQFDHDFLALIAALMGTAFFATSYNSGLKWLKLVAFGWWAAVLLFVVNPLAEDDLLLIIAILDFLLIALPGYRLMVLHKALTSSSDL